MTLRVCNSYFFCVSSTSSYQSINDQILWCCFDFLFFFLFNFDYLLTFLLFVVICSFIARANFFCLLPLTSTLCTFYFLSHRFFVQFSPWFPLPLWWFSVVFSLLIVLCTGSIVQTSKNKDYKNAIYRNDKHNKKMERMQWTNIKYFYCK